MDEKNRAWAQKCQEIESVLGGCQSTETWTFLKTLKTNRNSNNFHLATTADFENHYKTLLSENRIQYKISVTLPPLRN
jgi:hypothetical protein